MLRATPPQRGMDEGYEGFLCMKLRVVLAIAACKFIRFALRAMGRGGTALPGKVAVMICPDLLKRLAKDVECSVITGTNGKTTSARMLEQFYIDSGASYFSNKSGSNLMQGITAEFALLATAGGKPKCRHAIIECDEGASKKVFEYLDPKLVLVTNVFRDQLDRFADVGAALDSIKIGVKNSPNAIVCLNADDPLISSIADDIPNKVVLFGVDPGVFDNNPDGLPDAPNCVHCDEKYEYSYTTYGHMGGFRCPSCGRTRQRPDVAVTGLTAQDADSLSVALRAYGDTAGITINLPGMYNVYNSAGAIAAALELGFPIEAAKAAMLRFECGFGRMEKFDLGGLPVRMILVKNQVGCDLALDYLLSLSGDALFVICLNDRIADGADVSWIEDVRFEKLLEMADRLRGVFVSGTRAGDMALRLGRAGLPEGLVQVFGDMGQLLDALLNQDTPVCIIPTYTAMLELRGIIGRRFGLKNFWE